MKIKSKTTYAISLLQVIFVCCFAFNAMAQETSDTKTPNANANANGNAKPNARATSPTENKNTENKNTENQKTESKPKEKIKKQKPEKPVTAAPDETQNQVPSVFFPNWPAPGFGVGLRPVLGYSLTKINLAGSALALSEFEIGGEVGLHGIPLKSGNPGLYIAPKIGYAFGAIDARTPQITLISETYNRAWIGNEFIFSLNWFKYSLGLGYAKIFPKGLIKTIQSYQIQQDFGILILPYLSQHLTLTQGRTFGENTDNWSEIPFDIWLHTRFFTSVLDFSFDIGPGVTTTKERKINSNNKFDISETSVTYLKALTSFHVFWKLGMSGGMRYGLQDSGQKIESDVLFNRTPLNDLNSAPEGTFKKDHLQANLFVGLSNVYAGLGIGWIYTYSLTHALELSGEKRHKDSRQGFGINYELHH